jgi:uncharacterized surface protein with fasciclin (FAS1) repeats
MKNSGAAVLTALLLAGATAAGALAADQIVGGAPMYATKNIVQNAVHSKDHTTLVALVKQAGLVETLEGPGPFTVFAPTNLAFTKLPAAMVAKVTSNNALLTKVLTYHVIAGRVTTADIEQKIKDGGGKATLKTVEGGDLTAEMDGDDIILIDDHGDRSKVTVRDVLQSNGIIDVVDGVLVP